MRNMSKDVIAIRADQLRQADVAVVDRDLVSLADEPLDQSDQRTFAQIVRARLEAQPQHPDAAPAVPLQQLESSGDLQLVARKNRREHRRLEIVRASVVRQRSHVLRQTRSAERETGLQVTGG